MCLDRSKMLTIYSKNNCGYCIQAKNYLQNRDIPFEEINIEEDSDAMQFILSEGHRTMPQIYKDNKVFVDGGYQGLKEMSAEQINEKLNGIDVSNLGSI